MYKRTATVAIFVLMVVLLGAWAALGCATAPMPLHGNPDDGDPDDLMDRTSPLSAGEQTLPETGARMAGRVPASASCRSLAARELALAVIWIQGGWVR